MKYFKKSSSGYILLMVLVAALLISTLLLFALTVAYRYVKVAERKTEQLRTEVYLEENIGGGV